MGDDRLRMYFEGGEHLVLRNTWAGRNYTTIDSTRAPRLGHVACRPEYGELSHSVPLSNAGLDLAGVAA